MVTKLSENSKLKDAYLSINIEEEFIKPFKNIKLNGRTRKYVINMRNDQHKEYYSPNKNSLENFLEVIYQIRCNMFHGSKSPDENNDIKLISWGYESLSLLINKAKLFESNPQRHQS